MKINFRTLIADWNAQHPEAKISQRSLAREMVKAGKFKNLESAINMIAYNSNGKAQSADYELLVFLSGKFNLTFDELIER